MPHYFNNILVVTQEELVPTFYPKIEYLSKMIGLSEKRGYGLKKEQAGGNGRKLLVNFDSLPDHIKTQLDDPRRSLHVLERFYKTDDEAVRYFQENGYISDKILERNVTNASTLQALVQLKQCRETEIISKGFKPKKIFQSLCDDSTSFNAILLKKYNIQHSLPENYRAFEIKFKKFVENSYASLINGNQGNKNALKVTDQTYKLFESLYAGTDKKPSFARVKADYSSFLDGSIEVVNDETGEFYNPKDFKALSKNTIYNYLNAWVSKVGTQTKRSGDRQKNMAQFKPYHSTDLPKFAGSIISVDDRQPPFEYAPQQRMWFYLGQDIASGAIVTWVYGKSKEGIILEFYRQMVRNHVKWGLCLPAELEAESSLNSSYKETFLKEGNMFQYVRIEANNARGKSIESRFNRQIRYDIEKESEGWISRPFARDEANQIGSKPTPIIPYDKLVQARLEDIANWNCGEHHEHKGISRWKYFIQNQNPKLKPINWRGILPGLGFKTQTSCNAGIIHLNNAEFLIGENGSLCFGDELIDRMKEVEGLGANSIDIYWLDNDEGQVLKALIYIGDRYICEAVAKPRYNKARIEQTDKDLEAYELMSKYVASVEGFQRRQARKIEPITIIQAKSRVFSDDFTMPTSNVYDFAEREVVLMPEPDYEDVFNDDLNNNETTFKTSLATRF